MTNSIRVMCKNVGFLGEIDLETKDLDLADLDKYFSTVEEQLHGINAQFGSNLEIDYLDVDHNGFNIKIRKKN